MIWFFTPYAHDKKYLNAIDRYFDLITDPNDWVVIMDGDTAFLRSDFGEVIKRYTDHYPDTGLFTCYASRCHYNCQVPPVAEMENDSIRFHKSISDHQERHFKGEIREINRRIAGHLMVIRKRTWQWIRQDVFREAEGKFILGVDTKISRAILESGMKIRLMKELYIFHYLRMAEGFDNDSHLRP